MSEYLEFSWDQSLILDPYPFYKKLLESEGPSWLRHGPADNNTPGIWLFSRYSDILSILRLSSDHVTKQITRVKPDARLSPLDLTLVNLDPPEHTYLRALCAKTFDLSSVRALEPFMNRQVDDLTASLIKSGGGDFMSDFAGQLPVSLISELMNIPAVDRPYLLSLVSRIVAGLDSALKTVDIAVDQQHAFKDLLAYFDVLISERRRALGSDLISQLLSGIDQKSSLISSSVLQNTCAFILVAGYETTAAALGNGMYTLLKEPDQMKKLENNIELIPSAVEEILRYESPLQRSTFRIITSDCVLGGKKLQEGDQVGALIGAANRDPQFFTEPNQFQIDRKPNRHLAFGAGIHVCLGALLSRKDLQIAFSSLIKQSRFIKLAGPVVWNNSTLIRSLSSMPIEVIS